MRRPAWANPVLPGGAGRSGEPLMKVDGGKSADMVFSVHRNEMSALQLAQTLRLKDASSFIDFSLYELPLPAQQLYRTLIMIPIGVILVLLMRSLRALDT